MSGKLCLYLSIVAVRSGSSLRIVSPRVLVARRPGMPVMVLIGIRHRIDSKTLKSDGSSIIDSCRGRNPRVVETVKAGRVASCGLVSRRTSKCGEGATDPILRA